MNSKDFVMAALQQAFRNAGFSLESDIRIEHPQDMSHGDWACTNALGYAKKNGLNPQEVATKVADLISHDYISGAEVAGPGFINITLNSTYWNQLLQEGVKDSTQELVGQKWLVEHSSPNLFKPFHIGHLVNNAVGNSLSKIVAASGAEVAEVSFPSDIGPGIAKAVWGIMDRGWQDEITAERLGEAYAYGSTLYKEDESIKTIINEINKKIYKEVDSPELDLYQKGREFSLKYFKNMLHNLGTDFEGIIFESESEVKGKELVKAHVGDIFEESEGAIIFRGSEYGLFDNVFINSAGFGTYLAKDMGLMWHKFDRFAPFDKSVYITDVEQKQHFQLVAKAGGLINPEWEEKSIFIQHGRLSLTSGKISSRHGNVPLAEDLISQIMERVFEKMSDRDIPNEDKIKTSEAITLGALRYAMLKSAAGKNIVFDFEKSLSFEGDSGPYIQYTFVRTQSILEKAGKLNDEYSTPDQIPEVVRLLERYPEAIEKSRSDFSPHHVANYVYELAQAFNTFYANTKILDDTYNLYVTKRVGETLQKGLGLLGIHSVNKM